MWRMEPEIRAASARVVPEINADQRSSSLSHSQGSFRVGEMEPLSSS